MFPVFSFPGCCFCRPARPEHDEFRRGVFHFRVVGPCNQDVFPCPQSAGSSGPCFLFLPFPLRVIGIFHLEVNVHCRVDL